MKNDKSKLGNLNLKICCVLCKTRCTLSNGTIVNDGYEFQNPENPCEQLVCTNGTFSTHISLCRPLSCFKDHHVQKPGDCCPSCIEAWANFCQNDDNVEDCEIVCDTKNGFGYKKDGKRGCDECSCTKIQTERPTTSTASTTESLSDDRSYDATGFINFYFYPNQNFFFSFFSIVLSVVLVACIIGIVLYRKKVYKRVSSISV